MSAVECCRRLNVAGGSERSLDTKKDNEIRFFGPIRKMNGSRRLTSVRGLNFRVKTCRYPILEIVKQNHRWFRRLRNIQLPSTLSGDGGKMVGALGARDPTDRIFVHLRDYL